MFLVLKYAQSFIKIYRTLAGALVYICALCTHLHYPHPIIMSPHACIRTAKLTIILILNKTLNGCGGMYALCVVLWRRTVLANASCTDLVPDLVLPDLVLPDLWLQKAK